MRGKTENETDSMALITLILTISFFSAGNIAMNLILGWEKWAIPIILSANIICVILHVTHKLNEKTSMYIYSTVCVSQLFYYSVNIKNIYDCVPVTVLIMLIISLTHEKKLIWSCIIVGCLGMMYHLSAEILSSADIITILRMMWHFILLILTGVIADNLTSLWRQSEKKYRKEIDVLTGENKAATDFLVNVSHEIRTPINAVNGLTSVVLNKVDDDDIKKDILAINEAGNRITAQVGDILDYSEIEMDRLTRIEEPYMLSSVINDLVSDLAVYRKKEIELIIDVDTHIPAVLYSDVGKIKKLMWHIICNSLKYTRKGGVYVHVSSSPREYGINLIIEVKDTGIGMTASELENVYHKFYQSNSGRTRSTQGLGLGMPIVAGFVRCLGGFVTIESTKDVGTTVRCSIPQKVEDPSPCMSVEDRESRCIGGFLHFDKFEVPLVREYYNMMIRNIVKGLGLHMHRVDNVPDLKRLLENINITHLFVGEEEYRTDPAYLESLTGKMLVVVVADEDFKLPKGSGARILRKPFYCFPVVNVINSDVGQLQQRKGKMYCRGVNALVVDDEPMNLTVARGILGVYKMNVFTASSGKQAIEMCRENQYDIVFMDHMMPEMDGVEAMKRIRTEAESKNIFLPIVALTANAVSSAKEMFIAEGFDGFVSKPIELAELERVLRRVLPENLVTVEYDRGKDTSPKQPPQKVPEPVKTERSPYDILRESGINTESGLAYAQNDNNFYEKLLVQFAQEHSDKKEKLGRSLRENSMQDYAIVVHALKSTAKMIGAETLSAEAKALESASKAGDTDKVSADHDDMIKTYDNVADSIFTALGITEQQAAEAAEDDDEVVEFSADEDGSFEFIPDGEGSL